MKYKIGLVLGGGGAKGAYQAGVLKALKEYKLLKHVKMVSGTSIGALNSMKVLENDVDGAVEIWENVTKEIALSKSSFLTKIKTKSMFSRDGFKKLAGEKIDLEKASKSKVQCYVVATPMTRKVKDAPTEFLVNGKGKEEILDYLLASSAIPVVFEPVVINGIKYVDGFGVSNVPVETLKNKGCNLIFVVPLRNESDAYIHSDDDTLIIDFVGNTNGKNMLDQTLDFDAQRCKERVENGYKVACALIEKLIKERVIGVNFYQKIIIKFREWFSKKKRENYYSLTKEELDNLNM